MAQNEPNFGYFTYVDDNAVHWNKRGSSDNGFQAIDGNAPAVLGQELWHERGSRNRARRVVVQDPATGRTRSGVIYTQVAYEAIGIGDSVAIQVRNLATTVNYKVTRKLPEIQENTPAFSRNLAG